MKFGLAGAAAVVVLTHSATIEACSCAAPGLGSALTRSDDRWGVRLGQGLSVAAGQWNTHGVYRRLANEEHDRRYELSLLAAVRPVPRLELSGAFSYAKVSASEGELDRSMSGPGDLFIHARFEAFDETSWLEQGFHWPALALTGSLRTPTASVGPAATLGLGAYEIALAASLERNVRSRVRVGVSGEGALRTPDSSLGSARQLGPRLTGQVIGWYWPDPTVALNALSSLSWEGETSFGGAAQPGSGTRQWYVGVGVSYGHGGSSLRSGLAVRYAPPISGIGVSMAGLTTVELSLAYAK